MYAVVSIWSVEKGREEEQQRGLEQEIVPLVRQSPGFVSGFWTIDRASGKAYTMIVLDNEEAARQFKAMVEGDPKDRGHAGVSPPELLTVAEVLAHADSPTRPL